jgi:parvulin-like peptidyl-prolyl isomerase
LPPHHFDSRSHRGNAASGDRLKNSYAMKAGHPVPNNLWYDSETPPNFLPLLMRKVSLSMIRIFITSLLAGTCALAQIPVAPPAQALSRPPAAQQPAPPLPQQSFNPDSVPPNAAVVTLHGVCSNNAASAKTGSTKDGSVKDSSCQTVITKEQFNAMLSGMSVAAQITTPAAMRNFAESYSQLLALANEGEKAGAENDPRFQELMRIARLRALADTYRHSLDEKYSNPSQQEIEAYYNENIAKYDSFKVERVIVPSVNSGRTSAARAENDKKIRQLANDIRERAARGEETQKLQDEVYKVLALPSSPKTDLGIKRRGSLPVAIEKDLLALKPGEVTKVESEMSGFNIYKLRSRDTIPVEFVKAEITRDLHQKNLEVAIKAVTGSVHPELNEQFFGSTGRTAGPILRNPQSSDPRYPEALRPGTPTPGASVGNPVQQPVSPK